MCLLHSLDVLWLNDNAHWIGWISALWALCQCFWESVTDVLLRMWMRYESILQQAPIWCLFLWSSPSYSSKGIHTKLYVCLFDARKNCFLSQWWGLELALCRWQLAYSPPAKLFSFDSWSLHVPGLGSEGSMVLSFTSFVTFHTLHFSGIREIRKTVVFLGIPESRCYQSYFPFINPAHCPLLLLWTSVGDYCTASRAGLTLSVRLPLWQ